MTEPQLLDPPPASRSLLLRDRLLLLAWLGPLLLAFDHATKAVAVARLRGLPVRSYLGDTIRILYSENTGAFLGLGAGMGERVRFWVFTVAVGALLLGLLAYLLGRRGVTRPEAVGLALVVSGGLSNWIDRLFNDGVVIDFMNVGIGPLRTGIFNLADMAITGGVILLAALSLRRGGPPAPIGR